MKHAPYPLALALALVLPALAAHAANADAPPSVHGKLTREGIGRSGDASYQQLSKLIAATDDGSELKAPQPESYQWAVTLTIRSSADLARVTSKLPPPQGSYGDGDRLRVQGCAGDARRIWTFDWSNSAPVGWTRTSYAFNRGAVCGDTVADEHAARS